MTAVAVLPDTADHDEWLQARNAGIGASEIAAVLGISPWQSPYSLYYAKVSGFTGGDTESMYWGRALEAAIADRFVADHPEFVVLPGGLYRSSDRPHQLATPDRLLAEHVDGDVLSLLECKTAGSFDGWGPDGSDEIPVYYRAQVLWQIDVFDLPEARVACLFNGHTYREYTIARDDADLAVMRQAADELWQRVEQRVEPPLDWHTATTETLKQLHPELDDTTVDVPEDIATEWTNAVAALRAAERRKRAAENELRATLGSGRYAMHAQQKVATRVVYDRVSLDTERLRADHGALADQYTKTTTVDQLRSSSSKSTATTIREATAA